MMLMSRCRHRVPNKTPAQARSLDRESRRRSARKPLLSRCSQTSHSAPKSNQTPFIRVLAAMPATEKDLADDAPWKKIQQNTFTRWCNEHLKSASKRVADLQTDLSDGLRLIALLEVLSQKKMYRKHHQRPTFRQMKLENVSVALEFLERENIKLVSIGEFSCGKQVGGDEGAV
ncbi:hypothetical protein DNTS_009577 [Danionella cerebrum]|uniref:Calponin-homology (CH) domain-containing protein n=1 Tax=Danionella cerebrum TaxID=2873325 RepID=A0A553NMY2_9TELE|nr:hypothetical protein DNTS_009577 [Danionella translucida]